MSTLLADELHEVRLDRADRCVAEALAEAVNENPMMAAFEIVALRNVAAEANKVLAHFMPNYPDSRAVDDCLVALAAAIADTEQS